jgi:acetate---CoA ligase (ADP-forming)
VLMCLMAPGRPAALAPEGDDVDGRIPAYRFPEAPARALARMWQYRSWLDQPRGRFVRPGGVDRDTVRAVIEEASRGGRRWLSADENARLLAATGIETPRFRVVGDTDSAVGAAEELGTSVAVKVIAPDIVHKTDVGGVALHLEDPDAVRRACSGMIERLGDSVEGFFVQEMVGEGLEVILGLTLDQTFGPLVAFGLGGTAVEVLKDVGFRVAPLTDADALDLVRSIRAFPLLDGYRGAPVADHAALQDLVLRLSWLASAAPEIIEMDLNPVRVFPEGEGLAVVDVRCAIR